MSDPHQEDVDDDPFDPVLLARLQQRGAERRLKTADRFMGQLVQGAGFVLMGLSGGCSTLALAMTISLTFGGYGRGALNLVPSILVIGGLPFTLGVGLFLLGRRIRK